MSIILDTRTQSTMKSVQYNGRQDPGGYNKTDKDKQLNTDVVQDDMNNEGTAFTRPCALGSTIYENVL